MNYRSWFRSHFESRIEGRYIRLEDLNKVLETSKDLVEVSVAGVSELGKDIPLLKIGSGTKVVLGWSQMHGNESTTTKAIFDFLKFIGQTEFFQKEITLFLERFTFYVIPILNPDGAELYIRENANLVDLNRDAQNLSQSESKVLRTVFEETQPELCLNLHDQRSIYGFESGKSATVSFLAPSADEARRLTPSRKIAMEHIVRLNRALQELIPDMVGRYDDAFNANCVGDTFQMTGVPTILFEAGHFEDDYARESTREFIFHAFLELFEINGTIERLIDFNDYFKIPENKINFKDLIIRNARVGEDKETIDLAIQYSEVLRNDAIYFEAVIDLINECDLIFGHMEIDMMGEGILIDSQEKITVGQIISTITRKGDFSVIIFPK